MTDWLALVYVFFFLCDRKLAPPDQRAALAKNSADRVTRHRLQESKLFAGRARKLTCVHSIPFYTFFTANSCTNCADENGAFVLPPTVYNRVYHWSYVLRHIYVLQT